MDNDITNEKVVLDNGIKQILITGAPELDQLENDIIDSLSKLTVSKCEETKPGVYSESNSIIRKEKSKCKVNKPEASQALGRSSLLAKLEQEVLADHSRRISTEVSDIASDKEEAADSIQTSPPPPIELRQLNDDIANKLCSRTPQVGESATKKRSIRTFLNSSRSAISSLRDDETMLAMKLKGERHRIDLTPCCREDISPQTCNVPCEDDISETEDETSRYKDDHCGLNTDLTDTQDLEYGINGNQAGLAIAFAVEDDTENPYIPSAVGYDPDAKPTRHMKKQHFFVFTSIVLIATVVVTIGTFLGVLHAKSFDSPDSVSRTKIGIHENIALVVGNEQLLDVESPFRKALDWVTFVDPMALTPSDAQFVQRYLISYLYYATSMSKPWSFDCAPMEGNQDACDYEIIQSLNPYTAASSSGLRWLSGTNECDWAGIDCDESFQIRGITLTGTGMTGTFPEEIAKLPFLQDITLSFGELTGTLPSVIASMKHLVRVDLSNNFFTGSIPDSWFQSRSFQWIDLTHNNITGTVSTEVSKLKDVKLLSVGENDLEGNIPQEIGYLANTFTLDLSQNRFNGTIPTTIGRLEDARTLLLYRNKLSGSIPSEIGNCVELTEIRLDVNQIEGTIPNQFWNAASLVNIQLSDNLLNGTISGDVSRLSELLYFIIDNNQFSGNLPPRLSVTNIEEISVYGNMFTGTVPSQICQKANLGQITKLEADCTSVSGAAPELFCPTGCCTLCCEPDGTNCNQFNI